MPRTRRLGSVAAWQRGSVAAMPEMRKSRAAERPQPYLASNMEQYNARVIGLDHRYWHTGISPLVEWLATPTFCLDPAGGNLRARMVWQARLRVTGAPREAYSEVIGPFRNVTEMLIELERRSKAHAPPEYWDRRKPTTRKAEEQLVVGGSLRATWLRKEYLQGEAPLTEDVLPPRFAASERVASLFTWEEVERALNKKGGKRKREPRDRLVETAPDAQPRPINNATLTCSVCGDDSIFISDGAGQGGAYTVATGASCPCGVHTCAKCVLGFASQYVERRDLQRLPLSYCTHGGLGCEQDANTCATICDIAKYAQGADAIDAPLGNSLRRIDERRAVASVWHRAFTASLMTRCPRAQCGASFVTCIEDARRACALPCPICETPVCLRCGGDAGAEHVCGYRRPALRGAAAGPAPLPCHPEFAVETVLHAVHALLRTTCAACKCAGVFYAPDGSGTCATCGAPAPLGSEQVRAAADALASKVRLPPRVTVSAAERDAATADGLTAREWSHKQIVADVRSALGAVPEFRTFGARELFVDMFEAAMEISVPT